jgi:ABC-2 type transport system ATP-binding protein
MTAASHSITDIAAPVAAVSELTVRYGTRAVLENLSLSVPAGCVGLLGPNGAGKTTLIKTLLGFVKAAGGTGRVLGHDIHRDSLRIRQAVGLMPEQDCHIPGMNAVSFVAYAGELAGMPQAQALRRAHEVLEYCALGEARYRNIETYSTGMKQRIKLAQALVHGPKLLFLDEPTNGLDPGGRDDMLALIRDVSHGKGVSVIVSSHLLPDIERTCDSVIVMRAGQVVTQGGVTELKDKTGGPQIEVELRAFSDDFRPKYEAARGRTRSPAWSPVPLRARPRRRGNGNGAAAAAPSRLVFEAARESGAQVRGFAPRSAQPGRHLYGGRGPFVSHTNQNPWGSGAASAPAAATPPAASLVAPQISDRTYRGYDGPLHTRANRWWFVALATIRANLRKPTFGFRPRSFFWATSCRGCCCTFCATRSSSSAAPSRLPGQKTIFRDTLWRSLTWAWLPLFLLALVAGSGSLAADNQSNALLVYLSKPLTKGDYLLGKWMGLFVLLGGVSLAPALLMYLFMLTAYNSEGFFRQHPTLILGVIAAALLPALLHTSVIIGLSAWSKSPRLVGATYAGFFFVTLIVSDAAGFIMLSNLNRNNPNADTRPAFLAQSASIPGLTNNIAQHLYGVEPTLPGQNRRRRRGRNGNSAPPNLGPFGNWGRNRIRAPPPAACAAPRARGRADRRARAGRPRQDPRRGGRDRMTTPTAQRQPVPAPPPAPNAHHPLPATSPTSTPPSISLQHASRWYKQVIGLNDVSCHIGPGLTALLGPERRGQVHAPQTHHRATASDHGHRSRGRHGAVRQWARHAPARLLPRD